MNSPFRNLALATRMVHEGAFRSPFGETAEALYMTAGFVYETAGQAERRFKNEEPGYTYSRYSNPTVAMFETRMAALEGAPAARATATGMAAVTAALMCQLKAGDHVVAAKALFGSCRYIVEELLPRFGVASTLVDGIDLDQWRDAMRPNTRTCFLETPTNPTLEVIDIAASAEAVHAGGGQFVVRGGELAVLEGDWHPSRLVILEFPDLEAAKRWYDSETYQEAKTLRDGAARLNMVAVEGLS
jgi:O-succinylhomoserine sulfhydrylase